MTIDQTAVVNRLDDAVCIVVVRHGTDKRVVDIVVPSDFGESFRFFEGHEQREDDFAFLADSGFPAGAAACTGAAALRVTGIAVAAAAVRAGQSVTGVAVAGVGVVAAAAAAVAASAVGTAAFGAVAVPETLKIKYKFCHVGITS